MAVGVVQSFGTIVVCGGGCYGGYYVRQLARARASGALQVSRILVVDQDPHCRLSSLVASIAADDAHGMSVHGWRLTSPSDADGSDATPEPGYHGLPVTLVTESWDAFFARWFDRAIEAPQSTVNDAVVPSPLMPNLLADWIASRLVLHRPVATTARTALRSPPVTPWSRTGHDFSHYASFATWMCPINCIEPPRCPETRGPRDWTMPAAVAAAADSAVASGAAYDVVAQFRTTHRLFGVGMFDVHDAIAADAAIARLATQPALRVLLASVSHCHGAMAELVSVLPSHV